MADGKKQFWESPEEMQKIMKRREIRQRLQQEFNRVFYNPYRLSHHIEMVNFFRFFSSFIYINLLLIFSHLNRWILLSVDIQLCVHQFMNIGNQIGEDSGNGVFFHIFLLHLWLIV